MSSHRQKTRLPAMMLACIAAATSARVEAVTPTVPVELQRSVARAERVVRVRILQINEETYEVEGERRLCGTNFKGEVIATYKGPKDPLLTFAAYLSPMPGINRDVWVGDELLLLLRASTADPILAVVPDVIWPSPSREKLECIKRLSRNRATVTEESAFLLGNELDGSQQAEDHDNVYFYYWRERTQLPEALAQTEVTPECRESGECVVHIQKAPFSTVEQQIVRWVDGSQD